MTRYGVSVTAGRAAAEAGFTVVDGRGSLVGATVLAEPGHHGDEPDAIGAFLTLTQRPLLVRRHDYGNDIPFDITESNIWLDRGRARKSVVSFTPARGSSPGMMSNFLRQCRENKMIVDVILWPEMHRFMQPAQYKVLCELYVPAIREQGARHVFSVTNYAAVTRDVMSAYWPGDDMVDSIGMSFHPNGLSLDKAAAFAGEHGKPLGIAEFGVNLKMWHLKEGLSFLSYLQDFFSARIRAGLPCSDLIYLDGLRDGDHRLRHDAQLVDAYRRMFDTLTT